MLSVENTCMHVCMYACMHAWMYAMNLCTMETSTLCRWMDYAIQSSFQPTYICMYVCVHTDIYEHIPTYIPLHTYIQTRTRTYASNWCVAVMLHRWTECTISLTNISIRISKWPCHSWISMIVWVAKLHVRHISLLLVLYAAVRHITLLLVLYAAVRHISSLLVLYTAVGGRAKACEYCIWVCGHISFCFLIKVCNLCMYVCMYAHMYIYIYIHIYTHTYTHHTHTHIYIHTNTQSLPTHMIVLCARVCMIFLCAPNPYLQKTMTARETAVATKC